MSEEKLLGDERREQLLRWLQQADHPLTGRELGERSNVSRQVIVGDVTLLKAHGHPIVATSQGYIYVQPSPSTHMVERTIVCTHEPEETERELHILVDHGVTVRDVAVEHPIYGDLRASIMVSNRREVAQFIERVRAHNAAYLSVLAEGGIHMHTIEAKDDATIEQAIEALRRANFLVE